MPVQLKVLHNTAISINNTNIYVRARVTNFSTKCKSEGPGLYTLYMYVADATNTDIHMMSV